MIMKKKILVDLSATILHHGHIRLLKKASKLGKVCVALTSDQEIKKKKGYTPELNFNQRKEILKAIKFVNKVIKSKWLIDEKFLNKNNISLLVHGNDNSNLIDKKKLIIFNRTKGISSTIIRKRSKKILEKIDK
jgi:glycerol-3-phosphate cytidylyltransferase|tara:strand:- start:57 stop:458 length:402 start_codon:yes stop_codon:yes gene_type:complete